jgi:hypothetical protein
MNKYFCNQCSKFISKANKAKHEKTQKHLNNVISINPKGGDLQTVSKKLPDFPWSKYKGEHHLPGHQYAGPGTRLDIRLDENNQPNPGEEPINRVDQAALKHDIAYNNEDIRSRQKADIDLIQDLNEIKKPTVGERIGRTLVKNAMKLKIMFGGNLNENLAQELHKEYRKPKTFLKVKVFNKDDIWGADLVEMKKDEDYKYILTVIDLYTKYAWAFPLKNKTGNTIKNTFEDLFEEEPDRIPKKLYVDNGSEFYNKTFLDFLKHNNIEIYSTFNQPDERSQGPSHNPVIERFNRTLKNFMWKEFTIQGNQKWLKILPKILNFYNHKIHRTIGVSPEEASDNPEIIKDKLKEKITENNNENEKQKFKIGDRVRIFKWKNKFEKGFTHKWSKEIFVISEVHNTNPIVYSIIDLSGEKILGRFYTNELQKSSF